MLVLPILTYCITIRCPKTNIALKELVAIEHKFLRYASSKTTNPMHYFDHDYTEIRVSRQNFPRQNFPDTISQK